MKKTVFMAALTAVSLAFSSLALAQGGSGPGYDNRADPDQQEHMQGGPGQRKHMQDRRHMRPPHKGPGPRADQPMPPRGQRGPGMEGRGAGQDHNFYKGGRLPQEYPIGLHATNASRAATGPGAWQKAHPDTNAVAR